jgi:hypothetical protein
VDLRDSPADESAEMTSRKKPGVAFWATVVLVAVLVGYPLSFGPACWAVHKGVMSERILTTLYRPLVSEALHGVDPKSPDATKTGAALLWWADTCGGMDAVLKALLHI